MGAAPQPGSKAAIRAQMRQVLRAIAGPDRARLSARVREHLVPLIQNEGVVAAFWPLDSEPDIRASIEPLAAAARLAIPRFDQAAETIELARVHDAERDLAADARGVFQPRDSCPRVEIRDAKVVLVPGLAFDSRGNRLGRGGGYYDRLLASARGPRLVGVCFECQRLDAVPVDPHDCSVDTLVTDAGVIDCRE